MIASSVPNPKEEFERTAYCSKLAGTSHTEARRPSHPQPDRRGVLLPGGQLDHQLQLYKAARRRRSGVIVDHAVQVGVAERLAYLGCGRGAIAGHRVPGALKASSPHSLGNGRSAGVGRWRRMISGFPSSFRCKAGECLGRVVHSGGYTDGPHILDVMSQSSNWLTTAR